MPAIVNTSRGRHLAVPMKDKDGRGLFVVILKYTFAVDRWGRVGLAEDDPAEPYPVDVCHGDDPAQSSIKKPSDLADAKPGTDVILIGHAHPPHGQATQVDVRLSMGPIRKTVRAHGLRVFQRAALGGVGPGPARPIRAPIPLVYERAWGGVDASDPERPLAEAKNHVGRGVARDPKTLIDTEAPELEDPAHPIGSRSVIPACFGAIHRHWQPRASFAGTYDERWIEARMPLLPEDFDPRYHVTVPPDQWSPVPLKGNEPIEILNATPEGEWRFQLPRLAPAFQATIGGVTSEHRTHLDTVLIDADAERVELTYRAAIPTPRKLELLQQIAIHEKAVLSS